MDRGCSLPLCSNGLLASRHLIDLWLRLIGQREPIVSPNLSHSPSLLSIPLYSFLIYFLTSLLSIHLFSPSKLISFAVYFFPSLLTKTCFPKTSVCPSVDFKSISHSLFSLFHLLLRSSHYFPPHFSFCLYSFLFTCLPVCSNLISIIVFLAHFEHIATPQYNLGRSLTHCFSLSCVSLPLSLLYHLQTLNRASTSWCMISVLSAMPYESLRPSALTAWLSAPSTRTVRP